jgi:hypothetical protein
LQGDFEKVDNIRKSISEKRMPERDDLNESYLITGFTGFATKRFALSVYTDNRLDTTMDEAGNADGNLFSFNYGVLSVATQIGDNWRIGANLKIGAVGHGIVDLPAFPDPTDPDFITKAQNYSAAVSHVAGPGKAMDIGALYRLTPQITLGFTARNIISQVDTDEGTTATYKLDFSDPNNLKLKEPVETVYHDSVQVPKTYVLGLAYHPFEQTLLAVDLEDITNSTDDQVKIHAGLEQSVFSGVLKLRAGCYTTKDDSPSYTAGLGCKIWAFNTNWALVKANDGDNEYIFTAEIKF